MCVCVCVLWVCAPSFYLSLVTQQHGELCEGRSHMTSVLSCDDGLRWRRNVIRVNTVAYPSAKKNEYSSHLQSKGAELWLSSRWERIPRDALLGHDQLWNLAAQTQLQSHIVTGAVSLSRTACFRTEMRVQLMGTDSEHSKPPQRPRRLILQIFVHYLWKKSSTNSCGFRGQRISHPSQIHHLKCLRRQQGGEGADVAEVMGGGSLRHTRKDTLIMKIVWKWNGRPCEGFIPPEDWWRQHFLGSYRKMCTSKKDGLQDLRVFAISRSDGSQRFFHFGWARGVCVLELLTIKKNLSLKPPTLLVGK